MYKLCLPLLLALLLAGIAQADPMRPDPPPAPPVQAAPATQPAEPALLLTSIYILGNQRQAQINGQWLEEGSTLSQYRVVRIEPDRVELVRGNRSRTLNLSAQGSITITHRED